jgi:hypothetical protein
VVAGGLRTGRGTRATDYALGEDDRGRLAILKGSKFGLLPIVWVGIPTTFPPLSDVGLGLAYGVYTTFALLAVVFVLKFVKETKGKELEDMV